MGLRWSGLWRKIADEFEDVEPSVRRVPRSWVHCPICDRELVGPYPVSVPWAPGITNSPPAREELVAKCPEHGRRPYNDPTKRPPIRQVAYHEDPDGSDDG